MTSVGGWASAETMRLVGMALLHFLWQGAAIAAVAFLAMSLVRRASAKYLAGVAMLGLMVAAPTVTFFVLAQRNEPAAVVGVGAGAMAGAGRAAGIYAGTSPAQVMNASVPDYSGRDSRESSIYLLWFVEAWFIGVVLLSLRPAAGFFLIERLRLKKGKDVAGALRERCLELQRRLGLHRVVRYCESLQLAAPAVAGWFRPVVLLPVSVLTGLTAQQLDAVVAHELAHVKRLDSFVNLFQVAAETLLFYHPGVWWLSRRVRAERENCCDDVAIAVCGNAVEYARALATMAEWQSAPALAMAANRSPLAERVARLLGVTKLSGGLRSAGIAGSVLCLCASVLAGSALLRAAQTSQSGSGAGSGVTEATSPVSATAAVKPQLAGKDRDAVIVIRPAKPAIAAADASVNVVRPEGRLPAPVIDPEKMLYPQQEATPNIVKAADSRNGNWTIQHADNAGEVQLALMEHHHGSNSNHDTNIRVSELKGLDVSKAGKPDVRFTIARDAGRFECEGYVNDGEGAGLYRFFAEPRYAQEMKSMGFGDIDSDKQFSMALMDVSMAFAKEMKAERLDGLDADKLVAFRIFGVNPEFVESLRKEGLDIKDSDKLVAFRIHGVAPEMVRALHQSGYKPSDDELVAMRIHGATPEWIEQLKEDGYDKVDLDELIAFRIHGVSPEFIEKMQSLGYKHPEPEQLVAMRIHGVTPEFVSNLRARGMKDLSIDQLVSLKIQGID
jgi:beta-lactamase regulating signal transducer with metallopeptidase domain